MDAERSKLEDIQTDLVHSGDGQNPSGGVASPIYQISTYRFNDPTEIAEAMVAEAHPEYYGRYGSPNTKQVEETVAKLEGGEAALAVASGMAAVSLVLLGCLEAGDHIVAQRSLYPTTYKLLHHKLPEFGVTTTFVDQTNPDEFARAIEANTRMIYVETPSNPTLTLTDLESVSAIASAHDLLAVADNTFATPFNQQPLSVGYNIVLHSATKYLSGHSDVVAGIVVSDKVTISELWQNHILLGGLLHPMEAWLLSRGLKTFGLRMVRHNANAMAVANFLEAHPAILNVFYPGLNSHTQLELAQKQMPGGFGGMVSFEVRGGYQAAQILLKRLKLISLAVSLGGVHSLITHPASTISAVQSPEEIESSGVRPGLLRLSVGLESSADIIEDLKHGLLTLKS